MYGRIKQFVLVSCLLLTLLTGCGIGDSLSDKFEIPKKKDSDKISITFGRVPSETVIMLLRDHAPFIRYLERKLSIDVQLKFEQSYEKIIEGMNSYQYDMVLLGPYSYVLSKKTSDYRAIVKPRRYNQDYYRGIIFTHRDYNIDSLEDLRGKSMAFVDHESTSGYLFPKALLIEAGIPPNNKNFSRIGFVGRHDEVVRSVYKKEYTAGATFKGARKTALPEDVSTDVLPILRKTRKIPTEPIAVSKPFEKKHPELVKQLTRVLISLHEFKTGQKILEKLGRIDRFKKVKGNEYDKVMEVVDTIEKK
ncbi:MAG: phosphate/phosphite/phosphonate ABC transporter substrate-binding protein [bacterium]